MFSASFLRVGSARLLLALLLVAAARAPAVAEDVEAMVKQGMEFRRLGRDREALETFQRAATISETPRVTAQIALAEHALGLWLEARAHLTKALESHDDPWIRKNQAVLASALRVIEEHIGSIEIWGTPEKAEVLIDGKSVGRLPLAAPISVASDDVALLVRAPGYAELRRRLQVARGALIREHVDLTPMASLAAATPETAPTRAPMMQGEAEQKGLAAAPLLSGDLRSAGAESREAAPIYRRWWFWSAIGVVVLGAGIAAFALTRQGSVAHDVCADPTDCTTTWR